MNESTNSREDSPWVEEWESDARRERWQFWAKENYEEAKTLRELSYKANVDYGKWLLASGIAIHGGAIYALGTLKTSLSKAELPGLVDSVSWNVAGLVFIMIAGMAAWFNFQYAANHYDRRANPLIVYKTDALDHLDDEKTDPVNATRWLAIAAGILSMWSFVASAVNIFGVLKS